MYLYQIALPNHERVHVQTVKGVKFIISQMPNLELHSIHI